MICYTITNTGICLFSWGSKPSFFFSRSKKNHSGSISVTILHNFRPLCPWASFGCFLFWTGDWPVLFFGTLPPPPGRRCRSAMPPCCLATLEKFLVGCNVLPMTAYGRVQARSVNPSLKVSLVRGGSSSRETLRRRRRRRLQVSAKPMRCALPSWTMWTDCPRHQALSSTKSLSCFASLLLLPVKSGWVDYWVSDYETNI